MGEAARFIWLHGFGSGPKSSKATFVAARLAERGLRLEVPDLNEPAFFDLTIGRMLARLDALASERPGPLALIGSSLGGYTAALWAASRTGRVDRLVLLAPAFDLAARWSARMGPASLADWRARGSFAFDHYALGRKEELSVAFLDDAAVHPAFPLPACPTLLVQGLRDDTVSPDLARAFTEKMKAAGGDVRLLELDEGHELTADLPRLWAELSSHLGPLFAGGAQAPAGPTPRPTP